MTSVRVCRWSFACMVVAYLVWWHALTRARWARPGTITRLLDDAEWQFSQTLLHNTTSLEDAVDAYRSRRRCEPPRGFSVWHELAIRSDVLLIEQFWDPIYEDLEQYLDSEPSLLRAYADIVANSPSWLVEGHEILHGRVLSACQPDNVQCHEVAQMLARVAKWLPNMRIPVNGNSSPRVIVPAADTSPGLQEEAAPLGRGRIFERSETEGLAWLAACPTDTPVGQWIRGQNKPRWTRLYASFESNQTRWRDVCQQPSLMMAHGTLVRPLSLNTTQRLLPMFAPARIAGVETAIRYPDSIYWAQDSDYHPGFDVHGSKPWLQKAPTAFWRGTNTGGAHASDDWHKYHRHRFVALTNATYLRGVRAGVLHDWAKVPLPLSSKMIQLVEEHMDTGFDNIVCRETGYQRGNKPCPHLEAHFNPRPYAPLTEVLSNYRFLFDVDGNSFSGRFHALLLSESVVLKATIYQEWHDARLVPWLHFVPVSNDFRHDVWDVLEFFLANENRAERIARHASSWATRVLRPVDMEIYLLRLLLEWARMIEAWDITH